MNLDDLLNSYEGSVTEVLINSELFFKPLIPLKFLSRKVKSFRVFTNSHGTVISVTLKRTKKIKKILFLYYIKTYKKIFNKIKTNTS